MFLRFVLSAVRFRQRRLLLAFSALSVAAALATTLFSVYSGLEKKIRGEFSGYGANLVIAPLSPARTVSLAAVAAAETQQASAAPYLFTIGQLNGEPVVLNGIDFSRARPFIAYWRAEGARTAASGECLAGSAAAAHFHLAPGQSVPIAGAPCILRGIISTGGTEENQILLPFSTVANLAGVNDAASVVEVRADGATLERVRASLQKALPGVDVRLARAIAETESNVVSKMRSAVFLLTFFILTITTLCVTSNFSELVIERSKEIGILKAIGATESTIAALFVSESVLLAVVSTVVGYAAGIFAAAWISRDIFAGPFAMQLNFPVLSLVATVTIAVAAIATMLAASRVWRIEPATVLRGD